MLSFLKVLKKYWPGLYIGREKLALTKNGINWPRQIQNKLAWTNLGNIFTSSVQYGFRL